MNEKPLSREEIIRNMKEDNNIQEKNLEMKIKEGTEKLKNTLTKIKRDMEKFSTNTNTAFEMMNTQKDSTKNVFNNNTNNNNNNNPRQGYENDSALSSFQNNPRYNKPPLSEKQKEKELSEKKKRKENEDYDSDNEYKNYNIEKKILEQTEDNRPIHDKKCEDIDPNQETRYKVFPDHRQLLSSQNEMSNFSKSGTFKSQSNNGPNNINENENENYNQGDTRNDFEYNPPGGSQNNFYPPPQNDSGGNSEVIASERSNQRKKSNNNNDYNNNNNGTSHYVDTNFGDSSTLQNATKKKFFPNDNKDISKLNVNNSNIHDLIKRDLEEYLAYYENKNMLKVKLKKNRNQWVIDFNDTKSEDYDKESIKISDYHNDESKKSFEYGGSSRNNWKKESEKNIKNIPPQKKNCFHKTDKLIEEKKRFIELKNNYEILKREKENIVKKAQESHQKRDHFRKAASIKSLSSKIESNTIKKESLTASQPTLDANPYLDNKEKFQGKVTLDNYEEIKDYEKEVLEKIKREELFGEIGEREDILGEFIDRVIDRSLYLYKNRHCHSCSKLLASGKSAYHCPKFHHLLKK